MGRLDGHLQATEGVGPELGEQFAHRLERLAAQRVEAAGSLAALGEEVSALGVARRYVGRVDVLVIDEADAALAPAVEQLGLDAIVAPSVMSDDASRSALARHVLEACLA